MATRTRWLLLILAVMLVPLVVIPTVFVGMTVNPALTERATLGFERFGVLLVLFATVLYALPLGVPRMRRPVYGPELAKHFNHSERKPLAERYVLSWSAVWLFFAVGNLIRSLDRLDGVSDWTVWDAVATLSIPVSIVLMLVAFRYKRALDRLVEEGGEGT